ncbi:hypothetical protein ETB97_012823 [Aspergillus alliaceus]|uniref:Uncharacterized protein n=1 Tax=Petromyces alliaceus TaxID=209559 RepID=A0A8H6E7N3_PETAA|nr:hypothetical protein ETB97_012823 [Aspergillus burnettii]
MAPLEIWASWILPVGPDEDPVSSTPSEHKDLTWATQPPRDPQGSMPTSDNAPGGTW